MLSRAITGRPVSGPDLFGFGSALSDGIYIRCDVVMGRSFAAIRGRHTYSPFLITLRSAFLSFGPLRYPHCRWWLLRGSYMQTNLSQFRHFRRKTICNYPCWLEACKMRWQSGIKYIDSSNYQCLFSFLIFDPLFGSSILQSSSLLYWLTF